MSPSTAPTTHLLTDEEVAIYLRQNADFFIDKPSLLADLTLPHQRGTAISLVERQVSILRERNMDMRHRLTHLIDNARINDALFEKTKRLMLSLLEAQDINDFIDALMHSFSSDFEIQHTTLLLFSERVGEQTVSAKSNVILASLSESQQVLGTIISNNKTVCGQLDTGEQVFIFGDKADAIGSTAITPIIAPQPLGVLAIGNSDPDYYRSSMNTLFLSYIGDVVSRLLPQYLPK
ncbi:MAG: hypothetical protein ACI8VC_002417 [Candidatus Endobugula sp.]|jgi:uncharacterized protein YigA (DUF484 family)